MLYLCLADSKRMENKQSLVNNLDFWQQLYSTFGEKIQNNFLLFDKLTLLKIFPLAPMGVARPAIDLRELFRPRVAKSPFYISPNPSEVSEP